MSKTCYKNEPDVDKTNFRGGMRRGDAQNAIEKNSNKRRKMNG